MSHPTFVINLKKRPDRRQHAIKEFKKKKEFSLSIIEADENLKGGLGLWSTIQRILKSVNKEYVIICEDDIKFTSNYSEKYLNDAIKDAKKYNADVLLGGISWSSTMFPISSNLFWVEDFGGAHFMVIFKKFATRIPRFEMGDHNAVDHKISSLSSKVFFMFPFIAIQKEFGYSDVTPNNNQPGRIKTLFKLSTNKIELVQKVYKYYDSIQRNQKSKERLSSFKNISVPTYIINCKNDAETFKHFKNQFAGKKEFDLTIIDVYKYENESLGFWLGMIESVQAAKKNNDDVIVICKDDHEFTKTYSRDFFLKNVMEAHYQNADYLSCGKGNFGLVLPVAKDRYWIDPCMSIQFIVVYKKFFNKILNEPFDKFILPAIHLSRLTANKMILYPFISQSNSKPNNIYKCNKEENSIGTYKQKKDRIAILKNVYDSLGIQKWR